VPIDARVDLHGLTQAAAHQRLRHFLAEAHLTGVKMALVITGKGAPDADRLGEERGVLRRVVPAWLASGEFRAFVIGFEPAGRRHGGEGALYVRIRGRKTG
jgi:DNA-nicking Smr family endonuclease